MKSLITGSLLIMVAFVLVGCGTIPVPQQQQSTSWPLPTELVAEFKMLNTQLDGLNEAVAENKKAIKDGLEEMKAKLIAEVKVLNIRLDSMSKAMVDVKEMNKALEDIYLAVKAIEVPPETVLKDFLAMMQSFEDFQTARLEKIAKQLGGK